MVIDINPDQLTHPIVQKNKNEKSSCPSQKVYSINVLRAFFDKFHINPRVGSGITNKLGASRLGVSTTKQPDDLCVRYSKQNIVTVGDLRPFPIGAG